MGALRRSLRGLAQGVLVFAVHAYRVGLSPHLAGACRHEPSCSTYALEALRVHGPWRGAALAARRVGRCHPFRPGGFDLVPDAAGARPPVVTSRSSMARAAEIGGPDGP